MDAERLQPALLQDPEAIAEVETEWRTLAELRGNAFVSPEWFQSWWLNRPEATSALIATARRADGSLAGLLPLTLDFARRPRMIRFAGASFGDRFAPVATEDDEAAVAATAMAALRDAGLDRYTLVLNHVERPGAWAQGLGPANQRTAIIQQLSEQPYIDLNGLDWDGFLATRSSSFRKKLRQRERKLCNAHEVVDRTAGAETLDADLETFFALHDSRWQGGSALDSPGARGFLTEFARRAQRQGWLRLRLLEIDGVAAASLLCWRLGDRFTYYQSGFDPSWAELSVGIVLLTRTIAAAIEEGATEFDMLLGTEDYKRRFQNASREVETIVLTRSMAPARLLLAAESGARRIGRGVVRRPGGAATARAVRRLLPTSRNV
jgi:CelD/BcsL family acetyltransferase involved in cellulose biosynthesis